MVNLCIFKEFDLDFNTGSVKDCLADKVSYSKNDVISYLKTGKKIATCPKNIVDPVTKDVMNTSFSVMSDDEYCWVDVLPLLIEKYNIKLPEDFVKKCEK